MKYSYDEIHLVGIGSSAGGIEALKSLLPSLPMDVPVSYIVVQHLNPNYKSMLSEILSRESKMDVLEIENGIEIEPLKIYVAPSSANVSVRDGRFEMEEPKGKAGVYFSTLSIKYKIYMSRQDVKPQIYDLIIPSQKNRQKEVAKPKKDRAIEDIILEVLYDEFIQRCVVVDENTNLIFVKGSLEGIASLPRGSVNLVFTKMICDELSVDFRSLLFKASKSATPQRGRPRTVSIAGEKRKIGISIFPLRNHSSGYLVVFDEFAPDEDKNSQVEEGFASNAKYKELEEELDATREHLQTVIEELEILPKDSARLLYEKAISNGADIVFGAKDIEAIKALESHLVWVANDSRERTQEKLKKIINEAYNGEYTKDEFFDKLRNEFQAYANIEPHKLRTAADWHIRQNQNIAVVNRARTFETKYLRIRAKMDAKTTAICRSMHGRLIPIEHITKQVDGIMSAKSVGDAMKWSDTSKEKSGLWAKKLPSNIGMPPYHFGCRTIIEEVANSSLEDLKIDEFGRGVEMPKAVNSKIQNKKGHLDATKYKNSDEMIKATIGEISKEGYHNNDQSKKVILGKNGCIAIVDRNNQVETCYPPSKKADKYFEQVATEYYDSMTHKLKGIKKWLELFR